MPRLTNPLNHFYKMKSLKSKKATIRYSWRENILEHMKSDDDKIERNDEIRQNTINIGDLQVEVSASREIDLMNKESENYDPVEDPKREKWWELFSELLQKLNIYPPEISINNLIFILDIVKTITFS